MEYADYLLKDSEVYKKYNEFNDVIPLSDYESSFSEALNIEPNNSIIKDICGKLAENLKKISRSKENATQKQESCGFLHFWLYDNIKKNLQAYTNIENIAEEIVLGSKYFNNAISNESCSIRYNSDITLEKWIEGKHLHDYLKNFNYLSKTQDFKDNKCEEYKKYISYIKNIYRNYKNEYYYRYDISQYLPSYSTEIYDPAKLISGLHCENKKPIMDLHHHESATARGITEIGHSESNLQQEGNQSDSPSDSNSSSIAGSSVSLIGIFVLFFTTYKFTPLGSWIYGRIWKKEKIQNNMDNVTNSLLDNHSEYIDINHNSSTFNIAYNPT
ncbi:PIR Superfamily Protein [Plasmodium ovale wallikeri]|uniref:PIR Superfamily Protein n=2 Tax=Plasmodium ovale TaxID=36330 RepID=A0A1A9AGR7_PLAOA|nr:PIR Superfamily Protein [Plasmodium ovale wallikeri]SBT59192.1 PIR Superfamily Protein [Plasmodium ovale wallikeri]SBT73779.1 PIR protein [Plasmodium ovale]